MPELTFSQPARRSLLVPILLALLALGLAAGIAIHFFPATTVDVQHLHTSTLPTHTVYKSQSIVLGQDQAEDVLFVGTTLHVENKLRLPIFLDDFTLTLTSPDGAELTAKGLQKTDLPNLELSFPNLKPIVANPLLRETSIDPARSAEGTVLFSLPIPEALWKTRKSATVKVDLYHQPSVYFTIPSTE